MQVTLERTSPDREPSHREEGSQVSQQHMEQGHCPPLWLRWAPWGAAGGAEPALGEPPPHTARHLGALLLEHGWLVGPEHIPGAVLAQCPHHQHRPLDTRATHLPTAIRPGIPRGANPQGITPVQPWQESERRAGSGKTPLQHREQEEESGLWREQRGRQGCLFRCQAKSMEKSKPRPEEALTKIISQVVLRGNQRLNCLLMLLSLLINRSNLFWLKETCYF